MLRPYSDLFRKGRHSSQSAQILSCITNLCAPQTFRRSSSHLRLENPQHSFKTSRDSVHRPSEASATLTTRGMDGVLGHSGCVSSHQDASNNVQVPLLPGKRSTVRIHLSSLWPQHSTAGLHLRSQTTSGFTEERTHQCPGLFGRPHHLGFLLSGLRKSSPTHSLSLTGAWLPSPQTEIQSLSITNQGLAGLQMELSRSVGHPYTRKQREDPTTLPLHAPARHHKPPGHGEPYGQTGVRGTTSATNTISKEDSHSTHEIPPQDGRGRPDNPGPDGTTPHMGIYECPGGSRSPSPSSPRHHDLDRCLPNRLGIPRHRRKHRQRYLEHKSIGPSHKCPRTVNHSVRPRQPLSPERPVRSSFHRQHLRLLRLLETGFHKDPSNAQNFRRHPPDPPKQTNHAATQTYSGDSQRVGRCPLSPGPSIHRMGTRRSGLCEDSTMGRAISGRPHGYPLQHKITNLRLPLSTSESDSSRCFVHSLGQVGTSLPIPSLHPPGSSTSIDPGVSGDAGSNYEPSSINHQEDPTRVLGVRQIAAVLSPTPEVSRQNPYGSLVAVSSMDRTSFLQKVFSTKFGENVAVALMHAFRTSTRRQQEYAWKALQQWLQTQPLTTLSHSALLQFFLWLRTTKDLASQTITAYKSALALPLREAFGLDLSSPHFILLMKSLFLTKPPSRPQALSWDLSKVLKLLRTSRFQLERAKEEDLLHKCLLLVALATGNRGSELAAFFREGLACLRDGSLRIAVKPGFLYKNQTATRTPPPVVVRPLPRNQLCPVTNLKQYLKLSLLNHGHLFIHPRTHRPLNRGQIALRICTLIEEADPTGIPRMHDLRRAAASLAWTRGVPTSQIIQSAFWARSDTFIKRYLRKCPNVRCVALGTK